MQRTAVLSLHFINEFCLGYNRMNDGSGVPEPLFNVNGTRTPLPAFVLTLVTRR